ncbi:MAG: ABC transporter ATP-binding protein [Acidobacteria bacterium]|nr:ABC transporter ATP-binding protein [Acidobacteriota bacterium]
MSRFEDLLDMFEERPLAIATHGLERRFGRQTALAGLDLRVPEGAVYLLVGPNGAGKTTTLNCLLDLVPADRGRIEIFGLPVPERGPEARAQIGVVPDDPKTGYDGVAVERLFAYHARFYPSWDEAYARRLANALEVPTDRRFDKLSKGQARRAQLVLALAHRPRLLLLDEPTDGLDPLARDLALGLLADHLAAAPTTVLISTHLPYEVEGLADHLGVLRGGRLVTQLDRTALDRRLHRLLFQVPDGWSPPPALEEVVLRREGGGRELAWTLWGERDDLEALVQASGATLRAAEHPTLEQACRVLLALEDR